MGTAAAKSVTAVGVRKAVGVLVGFLIIAIVVAVWARSTKSTTSGVKVEEPVPIGHRIGGGFYEPPQLF
jgi:hypothetical protein